MAREVKKKTKKKKDDKVAYTPMSEKEKDAAMRRLIKGLKDGSIKAPLPADLGRGGGRMNISDRH